MLPFLTILYMVKNNVHFTNIMKLRGYCVHTSVYTFAQIKNDQQSVSKQNNFFKYIFLNVLLWYLIFLISPPKINILIYVFFVYNFRLYLDTLCKCQLFSENWRVVCNMAQSSRK